MTVSFNFQCYPKRCFFACMLVIVTLFFSKPLHAQSRESFTPPCPLYGWDDFTSRLRFPEIARRASLQGSYLASLTIDSLGNPHDINIIKLQIRLTVCDSSEDIFYEVLRDRLSSTRWTPGSISGEKMECKITVPFIFLLNDSLTAPPIIKFGERPKPEPPGHGW